MVRSHSRFTVLSARAVASGFALAIGLVFAAPACSTTSQTSAPDATPTDTGGATATPTATATQPPTASGCSDDAACPAGQMCKKADAASPGTCVKACMEGRTARALGETFPASDGCNTCTCSESGVACTEKACQCDPEREKNREYRIRDQNQCKAALYRCPEGAKPFVNTCGCGCEQPASCPQNFNCMPGPGAAPCNMDEIKKKCPLSVIAQ
jgi:hypothetical protein